MSRTRARLHQLRDSSPRDAARLVYRKAIHRRVTMGRYGYLASGATPPHRENELPIEFWGPDRYGDILGTNQWLQPADIEHFRRQDTTCIVVLDGDRIAASSWMTSGHVFVSELGRSILVPSNEHFSCRSSVAPEYQGRSLLSHMVYAYTQTVAPNDEVWGFVYYWNVASIRSLANIGWQYSGEYWTSHVLGRQRSEQTRCAPRPAFEGADVYVP